MKAIWRAALGLSLVAAGSVARADALLSSSGFKVWTPVWSDEFSKTGAVDTKKWKFATGNDGGGNGEAQAYTRSPDNARVENGNLVIEARKESVAGRDYSSARLFSKPAWTYGRFEIRAKLPQGRGTWPAIWMLARSGGDEQRDWPASGEIDIMEHVGHDQGNVHGSFHTKNFNWMLGTAITAIRFVPQASDDFHVYAFEWSEGEASFYVDDVRYLTFTNPRTNRDDWPFDDDFFLILNVAVGGFWGGAEGIDDSIFPQQMLVDYVRVYR